MKIDVWVTFSGTFEYKTPEILFSGYSEVVPGVGEHIEINGGKTFEVKMVTYVLGPNGISLARVIVQP